MAVTITDDHLVLDAKCDIVSLALDSVRVVHDFRIDLRETKSLGVHIDFASAGHGRLAGFPWWDDADADLRNMDDDAIPLGTGEQPFSDMEQGWRILIGEHQGYVFVLEGRDFDLRFETWFAVPADLYRAAWRDAIARVRAAGGAFSSLDAALERPDLVRALRIGNAGLTELPPEIGSFPNLTRINLYLNKLTALPTEIGALKSLREIDLRFNKLESLPDSFAGLESLESVNLAENQLTEIPRWVAAMPRLHTFYVRSNPITPESLAWIRSVRPELDVGD